MTRPVIVVENLSKSYRLGQIGYGTLGKDLSVWWAKVRGKPNPYQKIGQENIRENGEIIWALKDINFKVHQGDLIGVIGQNGAGKSTLLKILSQVTSPTSGQVKVKGRIASLLEVGTGFHPELTGRENVFLNGSILGMRRAEVQAKFDEIVEFSEIEKFIDTPVKRYSSGMYVRLAFAVAAHLDPDILLVDEVLAVGDAAFQKKCLGKMGEVTDEGRTVLFVSHNMDAINTLTNSSVLLSGGEIKFIGETQKAIDIYLHPEDINLSDLSIYRQSGTSSQLEIRNVLINHEVPPVTIEFGSGLIVEFEVLSKILLPNPSITLMVKDKLNRIVSAICSSDDQYVLPIKPGLNKIKFNNHVSGFTPGFYTIDIAINPSFSEHWLDCLRNIPLGDIVLSPSSSSQSLMTPHRTWGIFHMFNSSWKVTHENE